MNVHLLYEDQEWSSAGSYFDSGSVIHDLGLETLFRASSRDQERAEGNVQSITAADEFLGKTLKRVMMKPLETMEQIRYRQEIMEDCFQNEQFLRSLYEYARDLNIRWEKLGKKEMARPGARDLSVHLVSEVKLLHLFVNTLSKLKELCRQYEERFHSRGLLQFCACLKEAFSDQWEEKVKKALEDITFFCDGQEEYSLTGGNGRVRQARIVMGCQVSPGMKLGPMSLEQVETLDKRFRKLKEKKTMVEKLTVTFAAEPTVIIKDLTLLEDLSQLEGQVIRWILEAFRPFMGECGSFFEELYFQSAFYRACYNLYVRGQNINLEICYPAVCKEDCLRFENLTEYSMAMYRSALPVGNSSAIDEKMLLIVTGANQGGKSTFLRSLGIAQVMFQCGMFVSAKKFESGIFPRFFTHFTRREDSAMNSGRLDEELKRTDQIVRHLGPGSMVLLNESFATTTEEEGSLIAYDIVRALVEAGVKVLTVTHLLSFAKRVYGEERKNVAFLNAERKPDGSRTYKMVPGEPELTSFGLDLYEQMIKE